MFTVKVGKVHRDIFVFTSLHNFAHVLILRVVCGVYTLFSISFINFFVSYNKLMRSDSM